jgi:hypothetical protein
MIIMLSLLVMVSGISAGAQNTVGKVIAHIPFDFVVGSKSLSAGEYNLGNRNLPGGVLAVQNADNYKSAAALTQRVQAKSASKDTRLIFNRYKDDAGEFVYFLSQVWVEGEDTGIEFVKHRVERDAAKKAVRRDLITLVVNRAKQNSD